MRVLRNLFKNSRNAGEPVFTDPATLSTSPAGQRPSNLSAHTRFQDLPLLILNRIAMDLSAMLEKGQNALELLPLRLVHPDFTSAITRSIFRVCQVTDERKCQSSYYGRAMHIEVFLRFMKAQRIRKQVKTLLISFQQSGNATDQMLVYAAWCKSALFAVSEHVERISCMTGVSPWTAGLLPELDTPFYRLRELCMNTVHLPLLPGLLAQAPSLKIVRINGHPRWTGVHTLLYPNLFEPSGFSKIKGKDIDTFIATHATDSRTQHVLARIPLRPKRILLEVDVSDIDGLLKLAQGTRGWQVFSRAEMVKISYVGHGPGNVRTIADVFKVYGFVLERYTTGIFGTDVYLNLYSNPQQLKV